MKTVLAAINAKYIHTGLAIRSVAGYARQQGVENIELWERTINHRQSQLLRELAQLEADVLVFSCYIWNIRLIKSLAMDLRTLFPELVLIAAGPEVSYHSERFLADNSAFDLVLAGEGEMATADLLLELNAISGQGLRDCPAILDRRNGRLSLPLLEMDRLPFPYEDLAGLADCILYYESMRGCPFRCAYCLSSVELGVRYRGVELVLEDLQRFLDARVAQVKFVDRTFNCDKGRAMRIWKYLRDHDNGRTNFHFELAGELLDDDMAEFLTTVRPGQFQFEIGVQSTNPETLAAIRRPANLSRLFSMVERLRRSGNIHLHLDLIAGLPYEGVDSFTASFNRVYALRPHQFQLGFLKVLKGSAMEADAERFGIRYGYEAPYQVLKTRWLSFSELCALEEVADMVETYYNSGRFSHLVDAVCRQFETPFVFYRRLAAYYAAQGYKEIPPSKIAYYDILGGFALDCGIELTSRLQWLCRYDLALHEKIKKLPGWVTVDGAAAHRERILDFLSDPDNLKRHLPQYVGREAKFITKVAHVECYPFHPDTGEPGETEVLFNYGIRDLLGRAQATVIHL